MFPGLSGGQEIYHSHPLRAVVWSPLTLQPPLGGLYRAYQGHFRGGTYRYAYHPELPTKPPIRWGYSVKNWYAGTGTETGSNWYTYRYVSGTRYTPLRTSFRPRCGPSPTGREHPPPGPTAGAPSWRPSGGGSSADSGDFRTRPTTTCGGCLVRCPGLSSVIIHHIQCLTTSY